MQIRHVILVFTLATTAFAAIGQPVKVDGGQVSGAPGSDASITAFKGIPFAAPPVGDKRWKAPAPAAPWQGVLKADKFSASCIQSIAEERKPWTHEFMTHGEISEDCLYLNVWTGAKAASEKRPVFVYFYGGGFNEGSAAVAVYDGEGLAKKGLVVVTINYRVGVLGFLAHPELTAESGYKASGNYGLLDQIAALRWVKANIAAFGGDAGRVTIAGQSAGGMAVHDLTASPLAAGLFHRAIVESGGSSVGRVGISNNPRTLADGEADGKRFAEAKGAASLAELRAMSWQKLTEPLPAPAGGRGRGGAPGLRFAPVVDGYCVPAAPLDTIRQGKQNDVPTLTGVNLGELGGLVAPGAPITADQFREQAKQRFGASADAFLKLYPAATDEQARASQTESQRDQALVALYLWAKERSKTAHTKSFEYLWDHTLPGPDAARFGAFHTSEVPYVLNTLFRSDRPFTEADHRIADTMSSYWANFATHGDPNGKGLAHWSPYGDKHEVMELGDKTAPINAAATEEKFRFFEEQLTK